MAEYPTGYEVYHALVRLLERASGLGDKLGPILFQLPPSWRANPARLEAFLEALRAYVPRRFAVEFRHESWLIPSVYSLLERTGVALCLIYLRARNWRGH